MNLFELSVKSKTNAYYLIKKKKFLKKISYLSFFLLFFTELSLGYEKINPLDFSGNSPLFLSKKQILDDLSQLKKLLKENYVLFPVLLKSGIKWDLIFQKLTTQLLKNNNPTLTHHFQKELVRALNFTDDSNLRTDLFIKKRHYIQRVEPKVAFFSGIKLARQKNRFRVLPDSMLGQKIVNFWFINCSGNKDSLFPILPERHLEELYMLGGYANHQIKPLNCVFENDSAEKQKIELPLRVTKTELDQSETPIYEFDGSRTPYLRWYRDGNSNEIEVKNFYKLARKLRKSRSLIIDVRGNKKGSFSFIEKWFKNYTSNHWKNVFVKERQTVTILKGLLNRVQWNIFNSAERYLIGENQLEQKRSQLRALIKHFIEEGINEKWVETKFIFNGNKNAPKWETRLIVIANSHCGNGCQFLTALTKQISNGTLIGTNVGPFPKNTSGPIFQLKNSLIMISFSHRLHLNHKGEPVSPLGYHPDYWLFPPMGKIDLQRFASKIN